MVGRGRTSVQIDKLLSSVSETKLLAHYLGVYQIPVVINSPLRTDNNPSFGIFSPDGTSVRYKDFSTGDSGNIINLLEGIWKKDFTEVVNRIQREMPAIMKASPALVEGVTHDSGHHTTYSGNTELEVRIRDWQFHDKEYWESYGINKNILETADVFPISHYFITKNGNRMLFCADKYAYAYVERKEGNISIKVYQPFNKGKFKWINKHDRSVLGLWRLMPEKGKVICICSSVKDALCLIANTGIPAICLQGEGFGISETAQNVLKSRFNHICILLDNDEAGKEDAKKLQEKTGFINIELPPFEDGKDISDLYRKLNNKEQFRSLIINLFKQQIL